MTKRLWGGINFYHCSHGTGLWRGRSCTHLTGHEAPTAHLPSCHPPPRPPLFHSYCSFPLLSSSCPPLRLSPFSSLPPLSSSCPCPPLHLLVSSPVLLLPPRLLWRPMDLLVAWPTRPGDQCYAGGYTQWPFKRMLWRLCDSSMVSAMTCGGWPMPNTPVLSSL